MNLFPFFLFIFTHIVIWPLSLQLVINNSNKYLLEKKSLPDLLQIQLNRFQFLSFPKSVSNIFSYTSVSYVILYGLYKNALWLDNYLFYISFLLMLRCFLFNVTIMPDSSQIAHKKSFFNKFFSGGIHDLMFSGHIMYLYAPILFQYKLGIISYNIYLFGIFLTIISALNMLILKLHYTIDIIVAISCSHWLLDFFRIV